MDIKQKALYIYFIIINRYIHAILACQSVSMFRIVDKRDVDSNQRCSISCQHLTANDRHQAADTQAERVTLLELHSASKQYHVLYLTAIHVGIKPSWIENYPAGNLSWGRNFVWKDTETPPPSSASL